MKIVLVKIVSLYPTMRSSNLSPMMIMRVRKRRKKRRGKRKKRNRRRRKGEQKEIVMIKVSSPMILKWSMLPKKEDLPGLKRTGTRITSRTKMMSSINRKKIMVTWEGNKKITMAATNISIMKMSLNSLNIAIEDKRKQI